MAFEVRLVRAEIPPTARPKLVALPASIAVACGRCRSMGSRCRFGRELLHYLSAVAVGGRSVTLANDKGEGTIKNHEAATIAINNVQRVHLRTDNPLKIPRAASGPPKD